MPIRFSGGESQDELPRMMDGGSAMNRGAGWNHCFPSLKSMPAAGRHSLGCHRPRVPNRRPMNVIFLIPRTGARWNSLDAAGIRSCSSSVPSIQWNDDQSSPCELEKTGPNPTDRGKQGVEPSLLTEAKGIPLSVVVDGANRHDMGRKRGRYGRRPDFVCAGGWWNAPRSWMNRFRRIMVRWEKLAGTYPAMPHIACALITWRALGLSK